MRGLIFFILIFATNLVFGEQRLEQQKRAPREGKTYQAGDVPQAVNCLKQAAELRMIQVNFQISGDGVVAMQGVQLDPSSRQNNRDSYYLFDMKGQARHCAQGEPPPQLSIDRSLSVQERNQLVSNCRGGAGDQYIRYLMDEVEHVIHKLAKHYKVNSSQTVVDQAVEQARDERASGGSTEEQRAARRNALRRISNAANPDSYTNLLTVCSAVNDPDIQKLAQEQRQRLAETTRQNRNPNLEKLEEERRRAESAR